MPLPAHLPDQQSRLSGTLLPLSTDSSFTSAGVPRGMEGEARRKPGFSERCLGGWPTPPAWPRPGPRLPAASGWAVLPDRADKSRDQPCLHATCSH